MYVMHFVVSDGIQRSILILRLSSMKKLFGLLSILLLVAAAKAQFNLGFKHLDQIAVVHGTDTLNFPWAGGLNNPQFSSLDVNIDGLNDFYAFERDGEVTRIFLRDANGGFSADMTSHKLLPKLDGSFVLFRDYDGDGKKDIFSSGYNNFGFDVHRNISDTALKFELIKQSLTYSRLGASSLYFTVPSNDLPAISDFDGDGDLDVLVQGQVDLTPFVLLYIENQSMDLYGTADSLKYRLVNPCWGHVREYISQTGWTEYVCDTGRAASQRQRHGGTTLTSLDLNNDGIKDLLTGDSYNPYLRSLINVMDNVDAEIDLTLSDTTFPVYNQPAILPNIPAAYIEDVDGDGINDMLVAPNQLTDGATSFFDTSITKEVDWYYRNTGSNLNPNFELESAGFFSGEMIDIGARSFPAMVDLNGDQLLDLVLGNEGYTIYGGTAPASLTFYENVGDSTNAIYKLQDENFANLKTYGYGYIHPTFGDLDDDGDNDMVIGTDQGILHLFRNDGTPQAPFYVLDEANYAGIDYDLSTHPFLFDLNLDGLLDLIVGDYYGRFHYHENAGTPEEHDFSMNATLFKMGNVQTFQTFGGESSVYFTRQLDSLGTNLYILQSNADGTILVYGPISDYTLDLIPQDSIILDATFTSMTGANIYGDFRDELIVGQRTGGLFALTRAKEIAVSIAEYKSSSESAIQVFPNPSDGHFNLSFNARSNEAIWIRIMDISGNMLSEKRISSTEAINYNLDLSSYADGLYIISIFQNGTQHNARLIKQ